MRRLATLGLALSWLVVLAACGTDASGVEDVAPENVLALVSAADGPLLLDVRTSKEFEEGHVPGATNIPHTEVPGRLAELEPYRERGVVVYCRSGGRAGVAAEALTGAGFPVKHLEGDMTGWQERGLPVE